MTYSTKRRVSANQSEPPETSRPSGMLRSPRRHMWLSHSWKRRSRPCFLINLQHRAQFKLMCGRDTVVLFAPFIKVNDQTNHFCLSCHTVFNIDRRISSSCCFLPRVCDINRTLKFCVNWSNLLLLIHKIHRVRFRSMHHLSLTPSNHKFLSTKSELSL